jgi:hypothetical protein
MPVSVVLSGTTPPAEPGAKAQPNHSAACKQRTSEETAIAVPHG